MLRCGDFSILGRPSVCTSNKLTHSKNTYYIIQRRIEKNILLIDCMEAGYPYSLLDTKLPDAF